jgi:DNA-binding CsgD family transcriptional regulator
VIIEPARPAELAELIVLAYGFTPREREVTRQVILGRSTAQIAQSLHISPFTVQDYLKTIFDKVGVHSRRELVGIVFRDQYWPRVLAGEHVGPDGFFIRQNPAPRATAHNPR